MLTVNELIVMLTLDPGDEMNSQTQSNPEMTNGSRQDNAMETLTLLLVFATSATSAP